MAISPSSPVTGGAQTGLTSPTYTIVEDQYGNGRSKQYAVTALGGTQNGVDIHSISNPFTLTFERPANYRLLGGVNPVTGVLGTVPRNTFKVRVRKGVVPLTDQNAVPELLECSFAVPAGADTADPESIRAGLSLLIGALWAESADIGDALVNGIM
jgi:hypothetical protein